MQCRPFLESATQPEGAASCSSTSTDGTSSAGGAAGVGNGGGDEVLCCLGAWGGADVCTRVTVGGGDVEAITSEGCAGASVPYRTTLHVLTLPARETREMNQSRLNATHTRVSRKYASFGNAGSWHRRDPTWWKPKPGLY